MPPRPGSPAARPAAPPGSAASAGLPLSQRSFLGHVLPESLLHCLETHGPQAFAEALQVGATQEPRQCMGLLGAKGTEVEGRHEYPRWPNDETKGCKEHIPPLACVMIVFACTRR